MIDLISAGINAGSRLIGGLMDSEEREDQRAHDAAQRHMDREWQQKFAQEGIRWKVDDAKAAGIHPLYALGANTVSFSPVGVGAGSSSNWSDTLGSMGQDVSRAIQATRTAGERTDAFTDTMQRIQLEGAQLDNDIKRASLASQVAKQRQSQVGPPMPGVVPKADEFEDIPRLRGDLGEFNTNDKVVNAEDIEKRYGDVAQEVWGLYTAGSDWLNHMRKSTSVRKASDSERTGTWRDWIPRFSYKRHYYDPRRDAR